MRRLARASASLLAAGLLFAGCHREEDTGPATATTAAASRCIKGVEKAVGASTMEGLMSVYYEECADLFSQPSCRDAWHAASKTPLADQAKLVTEACRKAYCPMLGSFAFDICKESFVSTPESIAKSWPPLFDAIVAREAGAASNDVSTMLVAVYARSLQLKAQEPAAASAAAPGAAPSGSAAPAGSSSAAPGASGSGSAAPPVPPAPAAPASGSAAPRGAVAPGASAKAAAAPAPAKATAKTH